MARKVVDRKKLREEAEAAPKKKAKRKSRAKAALDVPMRLFWGVFTQSMKRVALYEHNQKKQAKKKSRRTHSQG